MAEKSADAFRTISEVSEWLDTPAHVLRFWESKFSQVKPIKRAGGRRYYRPADMQLLGGIKKLLHDDGMTIKGAQKLLRENGIRFVANMSQPLEDDLERFVEPSSPSRDSIPPRKAKPATDSQDKPAVLPFSGRMNEDPPKRPVGDDAVAMGRDDDDLDDALASEAAASVESVPSQEPATPPRAEGLPRFLSAQPAEEPSEITGAPDAEDSADPATPVVAETAAENRTSDTAATDAADTSDTDSNSDTTSEVAEDVANAGEAESFKQDDGLPEGVKEPDQPLPGFLRRPLKPADAPDTTADATAASQDSAEAAPEDGPKEAARVGAPLDIPDDPEDDAITAPPGLMHMLAKHSAGDVNPDDLAPMVARLAALRDKMAAARRN